MAKWGQGLVLALKLYNPTAEPFQAQSLEKHLKQSV